MRFNLLTEPWLPVRLADGSVARIAPWEIARSDDPPVALAAPRPDFQAALYEFLIGLMQAACPPGNRAAWKAWLDSPPEPEVLRDKLAPLEPYFNLLGDRPLFLQDLELDAETLKPVPVAGLLIPEPTGKTLGDGTDLFLKRGRIDSLCPECAAMALHTLQAFAPSGGQGHRTGMRGGGPMSTIVFGDTLWKTVWSNVLRPSREERMPTADNLPGRVFPWAAPTRTSEDGKEYQPEDGHFLQHYWGMPRRIVLLPETQDTPQQCDVCGQESDVTIREYVTKNFGVNYSETWQHPLTPYRDQGEGKPLFSVKGKAQITGYQYWMGLVYGNSAQHDRKTRAARCVDSFRDMGDREGRLLACGYDMDNMKAVQWCEGEFPILRLPHEDDPGWIAHFQLEVESLVAATEAMRRNLMDALKKALLGEGSRNAKANQGVLAEASAQVWSLTESAFYDTVNDLAEVLDDEDESRPNAVKEQWRQLLARTGQTLFEQYALKSAFQAEQAKEVYEAYNSMRRFTWAATRKALNLPKDKQGGTTQ